MKKIRGEGQKGTIKKTRKKEKMKKRKKKKDDDNEEDEEKEQQQHHQRHYNNDDDCDEDDNKNNIKANNNTIKKRPLNKGEINNRIRVQYPRHGGQTKNSCIHIWLKCLEIDLNTLDGCPANGLPDNPQTRRWDSSNKNKQKGGWGRGGGKY